MTKHRRRPGPDPIGPEIKVRIPQYIVDDMRKTARRLDDPVPIAEQIRTVVEAWHWGYCDIARYQIQRRMVDEDLRRTGDSALGS